MSGDPCCARDINRQPQNKSRTIPGTLSTIRRTFRKQTVIKAKTKNLSLALLPDAFGLIRVVIVCLALTPVLQAVSPPPDGGYPGNTAEGQNSLLNLTTGVNNSGIGFEALKADTSGNHNTGIGVRTLWSNTIGSSNAPLELSRSLSTPAALTMSPTVFRPSIAIPPPATTPPPVIRDSGATVLAPSTRPMVLVR
jgi:hypothetical protein